MQFVANPASSGPVIAKKRQQHHQQQEQLDQPVQYFHGMSSNFAALIKVKRQRGRHTDTEIVFYTGTDM